jgi:hypothetical protein
VLNQGTIPVRKFHSHLNLIKPCSDTVRFPYLYLEAMPMEESISKLACGKANVSSRSSGNDCVKPREQKEPADSFSMLLSVNHSPAQVSGIAARPNAEPAASDDSSFGKNNEIRAAR